jgi:lipoprotein-releasing system ATP-binding protein
MNDHKRPLAPGPLTPMISTKSLSKTYSPGAKTCVKALNDINIEIVRGEPVAIVGPSGAGKSTLMHLLGGLDKPSHGKVFLEGVDLYGLSESQRARIRNRKVGFVFQFYHLLPEFTALENVMMPTMIRGQGQGARVKEKAMELLKSVGLENRIRHRPGELSGGESQRVAIARALINEPGILLCDEPTGNLDSKTSESIYELLLEIGRKKDMALVVVTHDELAASRMGRKIHMRDGKVV